MLVSTCALKMLWCHALLTQTLLTEGTLSYADDSVLSVTRYRWRRTVPECAPLGYNLQKPYILRTYRYQSGTTNFDQTWQVQRYHQRYRRYKVSYRSVTRFKFREGLKIAYPIGKRSRPLHHRACLWWDNESIRQSTWGSGIQMRWSSTGVDIL